ncbi:MAG: 50S ribosomal protein L4 [Thermodesulfobacteriota bacterium]
MVFDVINKNGEKVSQIDLKDGLFGIQQKDHLFYEVIKMQLARRRSGSASTKTRDEVRGGGAKPFKQKGTGRARQGSIRSPLNRHGGVVFGPKPRDYSYNMPKKAIKSAILSAFSMKIRDGKLKILDSLELPEPKTKVIADILKRIDSNKAVIITEGPNRNIELAVRNLKGFKSLRVEGLNLFDLLKYDDLVVTKAAMERIEEKITR